MSEQKVALVVGGGSGIGADAARKLAELNYDVAVMSSCVCGSVFTAFWSH